MSCLSVFKPRERKEKYVFCDDRVSKNCQAREAKIRMLKESGSVALLLINER